jgi:hypothetical protein
MLKVLYDGWALIYHPNQPAALHLLALLENLSPELQPLVALPGPAPEWFPQGVEYQAVTVDNTPSGRLSWEQRILPRLQRNMEAGILHLFGDQAPLFSRGRLLVSPTWYEAQPGLKWRGLAERLGAALGSGGRSRVKAYLWPDDLPLTPDIQPAAVERLPPLVFSAFQQDFGEPRPALPGLEDTYVLYHGPQHETALQRLLEVWGWASQSIGDYYPLVLLGLEQEAAARLEALKTEFQAEGNVQVLPELPPSQLASIYRECSALIHLAGEPGWGGPMRQAMAAGVPVVGLDLAVNDALAGPAAYLTQPDDKRALGAALITVVVEENLAQSLVIAGAQQVESWRMADFPHRLGEVYRSLGSSAT